MANPIVVTCTKATWTKIATAKTTGNFWLKTPGPERGDFDAVRVARKDTGQTPPTLATDGHMMTSSQGMLSHIAQSDVYIYPTSKTIDVETDF
jgi:hypothetical protein